MVTKEIGNKAREPIKLTVTHPPGSTDDGEVKGDAKRLNETSVGDSCYTELGKRT